MKSWRLFSLLFLFGCEPISSNPGGSAAPQPPPARREITLPENSTNATISTASNYYFVIDGSGSMGDRCEGGRKIEWAKQAVAQFLNQVPGDVNLGLYIFDDDGDREVVPLGSNNRERVLSAVQAIDVGGGTPLGAALRHAKTQLLQQYKQQLGYGEFRLIVVTDGEAGDMSVMETEAQEVASLPFQLRTIGLCIGEHHALRRYSLSYSAANNDAELQRALQQATAEIDVFTPPTP